jgi:hypothetical protein
MNACGGDLGETFMLVMNRNMFSQITMSVFLREGNP